MGQYQQWLHYRDVDQLLHTQLEELEEELAQLQIREQLLQQILQPATGDATSLLQADNEILRALAIGLNGHTEPLEHTQEQTQSANGTVGTASARPRPGPDPLTDTHSSQNDEPTAAISSAPATQNGLPPAEEQYVTDPDSAQPSQPLLNRNMTLPPIPHSPHYEPMLLPEDMDAFIDEHSETDPRIELPVWLRNAALHNANGPIDQETMRTNRLIQRWIERWGHQKEQEWHPDAQEVRGKDTSQ
jgi:hypothetical protein